MSTKYPSIQEADRSSPFELQNVKAGVEEDEDGDWRDDIIEGKLIVGSGSPPVVLDESIPLRDAIEKAKDEIAARDAGQAEATATKARSNSDARAAR